MKLIILALVLGAACASSPPYSTNIQFSWNSHALNGNFQAPLGWKSDAGGIAPVIASPVLWKPYTLFANANNAQGIQGGFNCLVTKGCHIEQPEQNRIDWSTSKNWLFQKATAAHISWSLDNTDPLKAKVSMAANVASYDERYAQQDNVWTWPAVTGYGDVKSQNVHSIWGLSPASTSWDYLRSLYGNEQITFRFNLALGEDEKDDLSMPNLFKRTTNDVLTASTFVMQTGDSAITDDENDSLNFLNVAAGNAGYWYLTGKIDFGQGRLKTDDFAISKICFSNFWHNSVIALRNPAAFKQAFANVVCGGVYDDCTKLTRDQVNRKAPSAKVLLLDLGDEQYNGSNDYTSWTRNLTADDYVQWRKETDDKGNVVYKFENLLVGNL